jgi:tripartite-type tricarboxylate transporter receptor subunit TctC
MVVGFEPGGGTDTVARVVAKFLAENVGQQVVVENRAGAGGNIAAEVVAKAPPDGYTLLNAWHHAINLALYKTSNYSAKDFVAISRVASGPAVMVVNASSPFASVQDVIAYAKANPGKLFNASAGFGSTPHLASALFESVAGVKFTSVQFKGGGPAAQSLLAGETQVMFATAPTVMGFVRAGRMRALTLTTPEASPSIPGVPGAASVGLPGYNSTVWFGLYAPAGTPPAVVQRIHQAALRGLSKPEVKDRVAVGGMDAAPSASPEAFEAEIRAEAPILTRIIQESGAKIE